MSKKVLILSGSPRKGGNSDLLCDEFMRGAKEAGNEVEKIRVVSKKIAPCSACYFCRSHHGECAHKDDMAEVLQKMIDFDYIVTMADEDTSSADTTLACFRGYVDCVHGAVEKGTIIGNGVYEPGKIANTPAMKQAYEMGKTV